MKTFTSYTYLTESTKVSTALETVMGVAYKAAKTGGKPGNKILLSAMKRDKQFKIAQKFWNNGTEKEQVKNLMIFGKKIYDVVGGDGSFSFQQHGQVTKKWATWANKSGRDTSKTDIVLGGKQYSVKNASGAQLMSGKKGESIATATAAADLAGLEVGATVAITNLLHKLEAVTTEGYYASVEHLKILKDKGAPGQTLFQYAKQEKAKYEKELAAYEKDKKAGKRVAKPRSPPKSILDIADNKQKASQVTTMVDVAGSVNKKFLKDMEGKFQENANEAKKLLADTFNRGEKGALFKKAFVFEAATGRYKFGNAVQQAKYMLCWKPDNRGVQYFVVHSYPVLNINAKIITKYADQIGLEINWKSSSRKKKVDGKEIKTGYDAYQNLRLGLRDTVENSKELQTEHYNAIQEYSYQLNEGFITEGAFWDKVKELSQKFVDKAKQLWGKFLGFIKRIVIAVKQAGADGLKALSNSLGFDMTVNNTLINRDISIRI